MNTEKMTVHRALAELKTLDDRILKAINGACFCFANKHTNDKVGGVNLNTVIDNMKDDYKSIRTLMNRRNAMKRAVTLSNATTEVEINGIKYRVAEAIEMKNHGLDNYSILLRALIKGRTDAKLLIEKNNGAALEKRADDYVLGLYNSKEKVVSTEAENTRNEYIKANTYDFIDPLGVVAIQSELEEFIENFRSEVDAALSVSNAITEIEFSYEVE